MAASATLIAIWPAKKAPSTEYEDPSSLIRMLQLFTTIDVSKLIHSVRSLDLKDINIIMVSIIFRHPKGMVYPIRFALLATAN